VACSADYAAAIACDDAMIALVVTLHLLPGFPRIIEVGPTARPITTTAVRIRQDQAGPGQGRPARLLGSGRAAGADRHLGRRRPRTRPVLERFLT